ncbi:conserved protein of unknown function [Pseudodesulfovibrio profundus]|uniref:YgjP-like metallopeptidase domain-containing protein n=1 Tax=Pseudodesulfovibrio profundus TaxID=57320 RepID=A0A2C8F8H0_9BACT|nr:YgjP-like metallopeptidase domain-containing protein [Pseudodesulfovibrio profundus]SOB58447.1 conserved protein of unknown function [Pseudodesulfovibrio profundus]
MTEFLDMPLTVKPHPRAKRVLVKLVPGKGIEVVVPKRFDTRQVPAILEEKRRWLRETSRKMMERGYDLSGTPPELPTNLDLKACGRDYAIGYVDRPGRVRITENGLRLMVTGPKEDRETIFDALSKFTAAKAREFVLPMLDSMSRRLDLPYSALRVRRQKTRWGSCSARGTISINAKLMFLPVELVEHLLLHELCHTRHLNHSPQYWKLVARHQPDFQRYERLLSKAGRLVPAWFG